mmetsp:Transcript_11916/g.34087  ORF Transcript_11916/g.34087 Transcript_11916/m.34087 type:complete len:247 (-) Transcript_11916:449-1189(-)
MMHIAMSMRLGLHLPSTLAEAQTRHGILESGHLILTNDGHLPGLEAKVIIVLEQLPGGGVGIATGHNDQRNPHLPPSRLDVRHPLHGLDVPGVHGQVALVGHQVGFQAELDAGISQPLAEAAGDKDKGYGINAGEAGLFGLREGHAGVAVGFQRVVLEILPLGHRGGEVREGVGPVGTLLEEDAGLGEVGGQATGVRGVEVGQLLREANLAVVVGVGGGPIAVHVGLGIETDVALDQILQCCLAAG